jgi:hypothetical protein
MHWQNDSLQLNVYGSVYVSVWVLTSACDLLWGDQRCSAQEHPLLRQVRADAYTAAAIDSSKQGRKCWASARTLPRLFTPQNILVAVACVCMVALDFRGQVIAINQDITPQGTPVVPGDSRVWSRKLSGRSTAYALVNLQVIHTCPRNPQICAALC